METEATLLEKLELIKKLKEQKDAASSELHEKRAYLNMEIEEIEEQFDGQIKSLEKMVGYGLSMLFAHNSMYDLKNRLRSLYRKHSYDPTEINKAKYDGAKCIAGLILSYEEIEQMEETEYECIYEHCGYDYPGND